MTSIVVVGSLNADTSVRVAHLPAPGETVLARGSERFAGGKGGNQAIAAARLGGQVSFVGAVGRDDDGRFLCDALRAEGIGLDEVHERGSVPTGRAFVFLDDEAENNIVVVPGANATVSPTDIEHAESCLEAAGVVVAQLEIPLEAVQAAATTAAAATFILNPAPAQELPASLLDRVDVLIVNETEFGVVLGADASAGDEQLRAALQRPGVPTCVILTRGGEGTVVWHDGELTTFAPPPVHVVDTTGAGDTFVGALAARLAAGDELPAAARYATAAASYSVQTRGATPGIPTPPKLEAFLETLGPAWDEINTRESIEGAHP